MNPATLDVSHDPWVVALSYLMASYASFVALDLAKRVRHTDPALARAWWAAGSLTMGTGIWAMHFVGMLAMSLPIAVGYRSSVTALSWVAGVGVSAIALYVASRSRLTGRRLAAGAVAMGLGICTMHYTGMAALELAPGVQWQPWLVAASVAVAVGASAAALLMFFGLRRLSGRQATYGQHLAALVMGTAISGMHYTGMAAASFPAGAVCLSANQLSGQRLVLLVSLAAGALLTLAFLISLLDARLQRRADQLTQSLRTASDELHDQALRDTLTGLPTMQIFRDRLQGAVERCVRGGGGTAAVLYVNLDGFKPLNEAFGHAFGDQVLREIGQRLAVEMSGSGCVARLAGDEFLVLLEGNPDHAALALAAQQLVSACAAPVSVASEEVRISCSVGIAAYPDNGPQAELLAHANAAMETAKRKGGAGYAFFAQHMNADVRDQIELKRDLRTAIADGQLELHYQPKLCAASGRLTGVEALLRWRHPTRGMVSPAVFIPVAERFGLIGALGDWVINQACAQVRSWLDAGQALHVAVNLSVHQLRQEDLDGRVRQALTWHRVEPAMLTMEITETAAMDDAESTAATIERLRRTGVHLSIDDFGTGYSSLSYLRRLKAQELKIDRSFVVDLADSVDARAVVQGVINLAHALGLKVVAEGVETPAQQAILAAQHCDELQGFLFARPMPGKDVLNWLATHLAQEAAAQAHPA